MDSSMCSMAFNARVTLSRTRRAASRAQAGTSSGASGGWRLMLLDRLGSGLEGRHPRDYRQACVHGLELS